MKNYGRDVFINISGSQHAEDEFNVIRNEAPCSVYGCSTNCILQCHLCRKSYCSEHLHLDLHNLKNIAIINQLKMINQF